MKQLPCFFVAAVAFFCGSQALDKSFRLSNDWMPSKYELLLHFDQTHVVQHGSVIIQMNSTASTDKVTLHAESLANLANPSNRLDCNSESDQHRIVSTNQNPKQQTVTYSLATSVPNGTSCTLSIANYTWTLSANRTIGAYKDDNTTTTTQVLAVTQFEDIFARRVFPCFDEPRFKATFVLKIGISENETNNVIVLSNTPPIRRFNSTSQEMFTEFQETPKMSTYLVAFAVVAYDPKLTHCTIEPTGQPKVCFYGNKNSQIINAGTYDAQQATVNMQTFLKFPNPLTKIDIVKVEKHILSAMENWGLITTRTTSSITMIHEAVHQWFGNLVTCRFWNDFWLNEGLTSYFTCLLLDVHYLRSTQYCFNMQFSYAVKSSKHNVPISSQQWYPPLESFESGLFVIIYYGGAAFTRMLETLMEEKNFLKAMQNYIHFFQYSTASTADLTMVLQRVSDEQNITGWDDGHIIDMDVFMKNWLEQPHIPEVSVTWDNERKVYVLSQKCYKPQSSENQWYIPVFYDTPSDTNLHKIWLKPGTTKEVSLGNDPFAVKWNPDCRGFYIVNAVYVSASDIAAERYKIRPCDIQHYYTLGFSKNDKENIEKFEAARQVVVKSNDEELWHSLYLALEQLYPMTRMGHEWLIQAVQSMVELGSDMDTNRQQKVVKNIGCRWGVQRCIDEAEAWLNSTERPSIGDYEMDQMFLCTLERFKNEKLREHMLMKDGGRSHCYLGHHSSNHFDHDINIEALEYAREIWGKQNI